MYLKSIELQGFKSFPDRTKLVFDNGMVGEQAGVTVIVGPNGSGKSNIADAMRWVLGEISSKSLRGTKMEDVIFGGADSRRPMGYAEVSVTFDNTGDFAKLDCPYDEVTVTRRYFRQGESEYFINRRAVRLRDIYELFMNTGIGRDGYSIIGQGRIAEMVSRKSDERRSTFEDASGIAKYRHKKNEAERKLAKAEENMVRIMDVFSEVQAQVGPLEKEAGKAKRAIELMDSKKRADVSLWLYDTERFRNEIGVAEDALKHSAFDLQNAEESLQSMEKQNDRLFEASQSNKMASEQLLTQIREQTQENHTLDSEFRVTESNIAHTKELIEATTSAMSLSQKNMADEQAACGEHSARILALGEQSAALEKEQGEIADEIRTTRARIAVLEADIATALNDIREAEAEATDIRVRISVLENAKNSGSDRNSDILADMETYERALEALAKQSADKQKTIADYQKAIDEASAEIEEYHKKLAALNGTYGELSEQINAAILRRDSARQRVQTFKHMEESFEGYANSVRYVMNRYAEGKITTYGGAPCGKIYGPLSKVVSVDEKYVTAIETALGANLQHIVVDDEETAKAAMYALKKGEAGRATFFPLTSMRASTPTPEMRDASGYRGYIAVADTLLDCDDKFRGVVSSLIGRTLIFDTIDNATAMAKALRYRVRVVTLDGQQINMGGSFTGGSVRQGTGVLGRAAEIKRLEETAAACQKEIDKLQKSIDGVKQDIGDATDDKASCEDRRELLGVLMSTESAQLEQINAKMDANNTLLEKMRADYEQIIAMSERYEEDLAVLQADERSAANVVKEITALRQKKDEQRLDLEDHVADLNDRMTAVIIKISETAKDTETEHTLLGVCRTRVDMYAEEIRASRERIISLEDMIEGYTVFQADNRQKFEAGQARLQELNSKRAGIESDSMDFEKKLNEMNNRMREKMNQKEIIFREYTRCETKLANLRDELDKLSSKLWDDYEMTRADAIALGYPAITPENRREMVALQTECRNKLRAIGHVDLGAVEKYQDVKKRYDEMNEQITDLEKSRAETLKIIAELEAEMKAVFVESFNQINENFGRVFAELFGGGSAELSLSDPENILESGIEIKAAPPGKIIKNLMQLSGGEQAFIGVALFFAILKVNPTPFCILDEIEAALDEVNVERLAQYIKKYTDGTQFIMITHRRGTMAAATRLYGVTMPEHGISKVLTLDVNDIEKQKESNWDGIFG